MGRPEKGKSLEQRLGAWLSLHSNDELVRQADALALRRDMATLLAFVRDNKVVGTPFGQALLDVVAQ